MPKQYEAIRDKFIAEGMGEAEAKMRAARIYNATHPGRPVTRSSDRRNRRKRLRKMLMRWLVEKGDYPGHPFRGNQWVAGTGTARAGFKMHYARSSASMDSTTQPLGPRPPYERGEFTLNAEQEKWHAMANRYTNTANQLLRDAEGAEDAESYIKAADAHHEAMVFNRSAARIMPKGSLQEYRHRWAEAFHSDWKRVMKDLADQVKRGKKPKQINISEAKTWPEGGPLEGGTNWPKRLLDIAVERARKKPPEV